MHIATTLTSLFALAAVSKAAIVERQSLSGLNVTEIPTACVSQCSVLESAIGPCESALGSLTRRSLPGLVRSLLPRQATSASAAPSGSSSSGGSSVSGLTQCASALCSSNTSSSLVECLNCAVANGEPNLTASEANSLLSQLSQLCGLVGGGTISGSVTASATTTGPFTSINVASLTAAAATASASRASGASGSGSAASSSTSKSAGGRLEAGEAGWFVLALGAVLGLVF